MSDFVETTAGASKGGFAGIKKIRGLQVELKKIPQPENWGSDYDAKDQVVITLEDASILEMAPGEEPFELKENKYTGYVAYAKTGKTPHANSGYIKGFVASAEKLGKTPTGFNGQYVTLEKKSVVCFQKPKIDPETKKPILGEDGKKVLEDVVANVWTYVADETSGSASVRDVARNKIAGLSQKAALRVLLSHVQLKNYPEYKDALQNGTLASMLELTIDKKGVFQKAGESANSSS